MTISEMHIAFKLECDKSDTFSYPNFQPEEVDFWLNKSIKGFIKERYSGNNYKREGFEQSQKRMEDLRTLLIEVELFPALTFPFAKKPNSFVIEYPDDYWLTVDENAKITNYYDCHKTHIVTQYIDNPLAKGKLIDPNWLALQNQFNVKPITTDQYSTKILDPFSMHVYQYDYVEPLRLSYYNHAELITDGNYDILSYVVRYIKEPVTVSLTNGVDCELAEITHDEIVSKAVSMVLENIESQRYQSNTIEQTKVE